MTERKRFIAGAVCPSCQAQDSLAMWRESGAEIVACVKCGYRMHEADKTVHGDGHQDALVIGIFDPD